MEGKSNECVRVLGLIPGVMKEGEFSCYLIFLIRLFSYDNQANYARTLTMAEVSPNILVILGWVLCKPSFPQAYTIGRLAYLFWLFNSSKKINNVTSDLN